MPMPRPPTHTPLPLRGAHRGLRHRGVMLNALSLNLNAAPLTSDCGRVGGDRRQQCRGFAEPLCMPMHQCAPPPAFPPCLGPLLRLGAGARPPEWQQGSNSKWWFHGGAWLGRLSAQGACCSQPLPA